MSYNDSDMRWSLEVPVKRYHNENEGIRKE
jgi:hypothetical protein